MILGLVVEGDNDLEPYRAFVRKIRDDAEEIPGKPCGGVGRLKREFLGHLKEFQDNTQRTVDKALVIRDSDCRDPAPLEEELKQILQQSEFQPTYPVHFYVTKCMLETWLLADVDAINQVAHRRGKNKTVQAIITDLENVVDAKNLFLRTLSRATLPADGKVYAEIAETSDVQRIIQRCPYFQEFAKRVRAC